MYMWCSLVKIQLALYPLVHYSFQVGVRVRESHQYSAAQIGKTVMEVGCNERKTVNATIIMQCCFSFTSCGTQE